MRTTSEALEGRKPIVGEQHGSWLNNSTASVVDDILSAFWGVAATPGNGLNGPLSAGAQPLEYGVGVAALISARIWPDQGLLNQPESA